MKNIRIGNDIKVEWSIFKKGGGVFLLDGLDLIVNIKDKYGCKKIDDFTIAGNVIRWTFKGKDQRRTGIYSLELVINKDEDGMITTDACQFVNLVSCTCDAGSDSTGVHTESIELRSSLIIGGGGEGGGSYDDTAIWKAVNNKVDKEKGKGLSTNDYTDEDREKLAGLENYDDSGIKQDIEDLSKKVEDLEQGGQGGSTPDLSEYLTREEFYEASEGFAPADALEGKQDTIEDLDSIRSGAGKGATAVQPSALADYATTQQLTELSAEVGKKQDTITDLETIRSGAAKGATALQSVPDEYTTKTYVDNAISKIPQGGGGDDTLLRMLAGQSANFVYEDVDGKIHSIAGGVSYNWAKSKGIATSLKKILYMSFAPTSKTMQGTFQQASNLEEIFAKPVLPAIQADNNYVEKLNSFFEGCAKMTDFEFVKYWDVSHVTTMASMFSGTSAQTYPVEDWDTASLTNMEGTFGNNLALKYLDLSKWDTSKVTNMTNFVFECHNIETLGLPSIPNGLPYAVILGYGINTLQNIFMTEDALIKGSIMFNTSPQLTTESVQTLIDHLDTENVGTLTLHADAKARYDAQYGAGACATAVTSKGWTLA